jgi:hypothetical protein
LHWCWWGSWCGSFSGRQRNHPAAIEAIRDIAIIALVLQTCLFGTVLVIMLVMVVRLVNMLEFEIKPISGKDQRNGRHGKRGTTTFVGENVVKPVTKATAYAVGVRKGLTGAIWRSPAESGRIRRTETRAEER